MPQFLTMLDEAPTACTTIEEVFPPPGACSTLLYMLLANLVARSARKDKTGGRLRGRMGGRAGGAGAAGGRVEGPQPKSGWILTAPHTDLIRVGQQSYGWRSSRAARGAFRELEAGGAEGVGLGLWTRKLLAGSCCGA